MMQHSQPPGRAPLGLRPRSAGVRAPRAPQPRRLCRVLAGGIVVAGLLISCRAPEQPPTPAGDRPPAAPTETKAAEPKAAGPKAAEPTPQAAAPSPEGPAAEPVKPPRSGLVRSGQPEAPPPAKAPARQDPTALPHVARSREPLTEGTAEQLMAIDKANKALAAGDEGQALVAFAEAFEGPTSGAGITGGIGAASLHEQAGRADEARAIYDQLLVKVPDVAEIRFTAGRFFGSVGDKTRAIVEFEKALEIQPEFLPAYPMLGALLTQIGKGEDAAQLMLTYEMRLKALLDRLDNTQARWFTRRPVIDILALIDDERATRALIKALTDPQPEIRLAAGDALALDPAPEALKALAKAVIDEQDPIFKRALAASLRRAEALARADLQKAGPVPKMPPPKMPAPRSP